MITLQKIQKKIQRNPLYSFIFVFITLLLYRSTSIFYGFELCDTGLYATFYHNIFDSPESVSQNFPTWLTGVIGGLFMNLFPNSGLIGIRILGIVNLGLTIILVYKILNRDINITALIIGLIISTTVTIGIPLEFFHNPFSVTLFLISSYYLLNGIQTNRKLSFALSGFIIALNIFVRFPNILDFGLIFIIIINGVLTKSSTWKNQIVYFILAYITAILSTILFMVSINHYELFIASLSELNNMANSNGSHGLSSLIKINISCYISIIKQGLLLSLSLLVITIIFEIIRKKTNEKFYLLLIIITVIAIYYLTRNYNEIKVLYFFSLISLSWKVYNQNQNQKNLSLLGLFMLIVMPLGSDYAVYNFGIYTIWLAVPLVIDILFNQNLDFRIGQKNKKLSIYIHHKSILTVISLFIITFTIKNIYNETKSSYFDYGPRSNKTSTINSCKTKYIYTTPQRAQVINELLISIKPFIKENDEIIAYESIPMIYYLTNTKPFLGIPWPFNLPPENLANRLNAACKNNPSYKPSVLVQKFPSIGTFGKPDKYYFSEHPSGQRHLYIEQIKVLLNFLVENNYQVVWENSYFTLYQI